MITVFGTPLLVADVIPPFTVARRSSFIDGHAPSAPEEWCASTEDRHLA